MTAPRKTLAQLAAEQDVGPVGSADDLAGPLIPDEEWEPFEAAIRECRGVVGLPWHAGDMVVDNTGAVYWRADAESVAEGWPWAYTAAGDGAVAEDAPRRPQLTLLVRDGKPVGGLRVNECKATGVRRG